MAAAKAEVVEKQSKAAKLGDFVLVDYDCWIKDTDELLETTMRETAEREGKLDENREYKPVLLILGARWVTRGLDEGILGMYEGEERVFEVPPEKAYGKRDPSKVRMFPERRIRRSGARLVPGEEVEINGVRGVIESVSGGRVRVNFNHPLASKTLKYRVILRKILESPEEKASAVFEKAYGSKPELLKVEDGCVKVRTLASPETISELAARKAYFLALVSRYLREVSKLELTEVYELAR
ncbi:MAG: peptidylprolyl isomerase [Thermoproteota archaeon]|nr:MAG: peptidylprolyl isomerase [Candidatus Korarchaeota archaeon]